MLPYFSHELRDFTPVVLTPRDIQGIDVVTRLLGISSLLQVEDGQ
jgi:hypothetical protein